MTHYYWKEQKYDCFILTCEKYTVSFKTFKDLYQYCVERDINAKQA